MSKNYRKLTEQIISLVGGKENIKSVTNCATRLRFYLADEEKAKTEELKKTDGIAGVVKNGGQYQVIIGPDVDLVMEEIRKIGGIKVEDGAGAIREEKEKMDQTRHRPGGPHRRGGLSPAQLLRRQHRLDLRHLPAQHRLHPGSGGVGVRHRRH